MKLKDSVKEYETDLKELYNDLVLNEDVGTRESLLSDIELIWYSRYGIEDAEANELDQKYLSAIYKKIKKVYPDMAEYFKSKMISAGANPIIFS